MEIFARIGRRRSRPVLFAVGSNHRPVGRNAIRVASRSPPGIGSANPVFEGSPSAVSNQIYKINRQYINIIISGIETEVPPATTGRIRGTAAIAAGSDRGGVRADAPGGLPPDGSFIPTAQRLRPAGETARRGGTARR